MSKIIRIPYEFLRTYHSLVETVFIKRKFEIFKKLCKHEKMFFSDTTYIGSRLAIEVFYKALLSRKGISTL